MKTHAGGALATANQALGSRLRPRSLTRRTYGPPVKEALPPSHPRARPYTWLSPAGSSELGVYGSPRV